jgi:hypothetical protein
MPPTLLLLALLLSGCSLLFEQVPVDEASGADSGTDAIEPDADPSAPDAAPGTEPDAAPGTEPDAAPGTEPDATAPVYETCDPFVEAGCYVDNDPLEGPVFLPEGAKTECNLCERSNECVPGFFCTGYVGSPGQCAPLCDSFHPCFGGACLSVQYQGFGFCAGTCF